MVLTKFIDLPSKESAILHPNFYADYKCTDHIQKIFTNFEYAVSSDIAEFTAQKMKFSIKDFFSKWEQIRRKLRIWSHLLKKSLMENFIFCAVICPADSVR